MQTGYDNFWMYQNIRHEPVLSLSKSDSYSHAVLTDSYKSLPSGGSSSHLNSYPTPQNSVASSHQHDHSRMTDSQCVWPPSVYSLTLRSSYANNFCSPGTYSSQSTSLNCSSQNSEVQQNYDSTHLRNNNLNFPQVLSNGNINTYSNNNTNAYSNSNSNNYNYNYTNSINNSNYYNNSHSNHNSNFTNSVQAQSSKNHDTPVSRIRVKDVYSLNNIAQNNSLFDNNAPQTYQKGQTGCALNYATMNYITSFDSKSSAEYVDYEKIKMCASNHTCPPYRHSTAKQTKPCDRQKFFQPSDLNYQRNMQLSVDSQFQVSNSKEIRTNLPSNTSNSNSSNRQLSNHEKNWETEVQNAQRNSCEALLKNKRMKVQPKRNSNELNYLRNSETVGSHTCREKNNNNIHYTDSVKANERIVQINRDARGQNYSLENLPVIDQGSSLPQVALTEELNKCRINKQRIPSNSHYQIRGQENTLVKITVPHTGQSSFVHVSDSQSVEENPMLRLRHLLESKNQSLYHPLSKINPDQNHRKTDINPVVSSSSLGQVNQSNSASTEKAYPNSKTICSYPALIQNKGNDKIGEFDRSCPLIRMSSPKKLESSNEGLHLKERVGLNQHQNHVFRNSEEISENILVNVNSEVSTEEKSQSVAAISPNDTTLKVVAIKQENISSIQESPNEQFISENQVLSETIKVENDDEDLLSLHEHKPESPISENSLLEETQLFEFDDAKNTDFSKANVETIFNFEKSSSEEPLSESKQIFSALKNTGNCIKELDASVDDSSKEKTNSPSEMKDKECEAEKEEDHESRKKYKSKINKEKLDLLIQFLNKEEEMVDANTSKNAESSDPSSKNSCIKKREKKVQLNHNRRKLSKTRIVKNKNNSREMISLISHKIAQAEIFKCAPETSQTVETFENSDKTEEILERDSKVTDRSVDFLKNCYEINNRSQEDLTQQEDHLKSESKMISVPACEKKQETSDRNSVEKELSIQEDDYISDVMRIFQNLKTHFCTSCNLTSSVDSFWVNVVSGELRCLNCFKNTMIKTSKLMSESKSDESNDSINFETNFVRKNETHEASENKRENMHKPGFENKSDICDELISSTEFDDPQKLNSFEENIKGEQKEIIIEPSEGKIIKNIKEMSLATECCTANTSRRQSLDDKTSLMSKIVEEQKKSKVEESLNKSVRNIKCKEDGTHKSRGLEEVTKPGITGLCEKPKRRNTTELTEINDETQNLEAKPPLLMKLKQINCSKEKCWASKTLPSNYLNKEENNMSKVKNHGLKPKFLKNHNEENLSNQPVSKSDFTELSITNKTQVLTEDIKPDLAEKSSKKRAYKEDGTWEEFTKAEKNITADTPIHNGKKTTAKEQFFCQKQQNSKKEIKIMNSSNESAMKTCSKESLASPKTHSVEDVAKKNAKHESLDKLKVQNASKDSNHKPKISEKIKIKETDTGEKSQKKSMSCQNFPEKQNKVQWTEQSVKRKNSDEGFGTRKVRIVEEYSKKEIKSGTYSSSKSKEDNAGRKIKTFEHEKQNAKDSEEKSRKNSSSKEECLSIGGVIRKETNQMLDSLEKSKSKDDFSCQKGKTSKNFYSKSIPTSSEMPRRKSKDEFISSHTKPIVVIERSKNEMKKSTELLVNNFKRNSVSKESSELVSKHLKIGNSPAENKGSKTEGEEKEKKHFKGKIPKKSNSDSNTNINEIIRTPLNFVSEEGNVKKEQNARVKEDCSYGKSRRESFTSERKNGHKSKHKSELKAYEKEIFQWLSGLEAVKGEENDGKDQKIQKQDSKGPNVGKRKSTECPTNEKIDITAAESPPLDCGVEKTTLLTELFKKTKRLSWTLLNVGT